MQASAANNGCLKKLIEAHTGAFLQDSVVLAQLDEDEPTILIDSEACGRRRERRSIGRGTDLAGMRVIKTAISGFVLLAVRA